MMQAKSFSYQHHIDWRRMKKKTLTKVGIFKWLTLEKCVVKTDGSIFKVFVRQIEISKLAMRKNSFKEKRQQTIGMPNTISRISNHLIVIRSWSVFTAHVYTLCRLWVYSRHCDEHSFLISFSYNESADFQSEIFDSAVHLSSFRDFFFYALWPPFYLEASIMLSTTSSEPCSNQSRRCWCKYPLMLFA